MDRLKSYNIIPVTQGVLREAINEYSSPKDKISSLTNEGMLLRLKRGLYSVPRSVTGQSLSRELIANHLYGPSYVSFESALSYHGMIPERVYVTKSATLKRKKMYDTPLGYYQYIHIPEAYYPIGLKLEIIENSHAYIVAGPEKALCDLILSTSGLRLQSAKAAGEYIISDLRFDEDAVIMLDVSIIEECAAKGYKGTDMQNVIKFLNKLH
ncbi:MAG: type IV toxin-antitoxin system AbiEi family antitoxin domain-containing protein [Bacteroidota bacterium]